MAKVTFPPKIGTTGVVSLVFDFSSLLGVTETVTSIASASIVPINTGDTSPLTVFGTPVVASPFITVQVQNGTLGMLYLITLTANSSSTNNPTLAGYLAVTPGAP